MNDEMIVAVYDFAADCDAAIVALKQAGVQQADISVHSHTVTRSSETSVAEPIRESGFWPGLFGGRTDQDIAVYDRSLQSGSIILSVRATAPQIQPVTQILESHHPIDIDQYVAEPAEAEPMAPSRPFEAPVPEAGLGKAVAGDPALELSEETLSVGKRVVNRGTTRVRRYVVETPVEETILLHEEKVVLERRPALAGEHPVTDGFTERTIEMTETSEEAVVSKSVHVYEEVRLSKTSSDRVETIRDSVRHEEAEIEKIPDIDTQIAEAPIHDPRISKV